MTSSDRRTAPGRVPGRLEDQIRSDWRRMHFCRRNGWGWERRYRNRLWAALALRRAYQAGTADAR